MPAADVDAVSGRVRPSCRQAERRQAAVPAVRRAHLRRALEVRRLGSRYSQELGEGFARVVLQARGAINHRDPEAAVRSCFGTVFAATIIRIAYGPEFATPVPVDDGAFVADLGETAARFLIGVTTD
jgi:hypothetical protein